jgi:hypothetical protein
MADVCSAERVKSKKLRHPVILYSLRTVVAWRWGKGVWSSSVPKLHPCAAEEGGIMGYVGVAMKGCDNAFQGIYYRWPMFG